MNKKYIVNTADISQLILSAHSLKRICVEWRLFKFQFINEDEKSKAKIIPRKLKFIKVKILMKFVFSIVLKKKKKTQTKQPPPKPLSQQNHDTFKVFYSFHFTCQAGSAWS